jgi:carboxypeptidase PM20D1
MTKVLLCIGIIFCLLIVVIATRTFTYGVSDISTTLVKDIHINQKDVAERLASVLRIQTISLAGTPVAANAFNAMHNYLELVFPLTHRELKREIVNDYSLLYTWEGSDPGLKPILLMAHMDVVPVVPDTVAKWTYPPFAGEIANDFIWGRGALDMKQSLMGIMEAIEYLLNQDFVPSRTVYLAFGHDEELGGYEGAKIIAELLEMRKVQLEFTMDEGSPIAQDMLPGITKPAALIGLAEKGFVTLKLTATGPGGHGSMPPADSAIAKLARTIHRLETRQMPAEIRSPIADMFEFMAPEMPFHLRIVIANQWLFSPLLINELEAARATNATVRTTTAITILKGGIIYNVIPTKATAVGTFRILPGDTIDMVVEHVSNVINDPDITLQKIGAGASEPSRISAMDSSGFIAITKTINQIFPDVVIAPSLVVTSTDSGHYETISENSYRFVPMRVGPEDVKRIHGIDERIGVTNYAEIIRFYIQLLRNFT